MTNKYRNTLILFSLGLPIFLGCFDIMAVGLGLNNIADSFNVALIIVQWVFSFYMICNAAFTMAAGVLCDRYGAKKVFILGYFIFNISSLLNILSPSIYFLMFSRGLQGVSVCMMLISSTSLIHLYFQKETVKYFGFWSFFVGAGTVTGPLLGGILLNYFGWKSIFLINLPIGLIVTPFIYKYLPSITKETTIENVKFLPVLTNTVLLLAISVLMLGFEELTSLEVYSLLFLVLALGYSKFNKKNSWNSAKVFTAVPFLSGALSGVCSYYSLYTWLVITPLYLQKIHHLNDMQSGLVMLPYFIAFTISPLIAGYLGMKISKKSLLLFGLGFNVLGILLVTAFYSLTIWHLIFAHFIFGIGNSFINAPATALALEKISAEFSGKATAILYAIRWIGGASGACIATIIWAKSSSPSLALYIAGAICLLSITFIQSGSKLEKR